MDGMVRRVILTLLLLFCGSTHSHVLALRQPNIVLLVTDDLDGKGIVPLEQTQKIIANLGATFSNAFVSTPLCCPSRASLLTGRYLHNTQVVNNSLSGGCSSQKWQREGERQTFAKVLHDQGYDTFYSGKYLNEYGDKRVGGLEHVPPGWNWWIGLEKNSRYYNYTLSINGTAKYFEKDYLTDLIADYAVDFLQARRNNSNPFLMVLAPPAPHMPFTPAPRHKHHFQNVTVPRTPNFNPGPQTDKHWLIRMSPAYLPSSVISQIDEYWRQRWRTLLAVDELVETVIRTMKRQGLLRNTYFMFTSDNGYHLGHYGLPWDKRQPYDTDVRIPFLVRGPGVPRQLVIEDPILLMDVAPTILEMAGLPRPSTMDGKSFLPLLKREKKERRKRKKFSRTFLLEYRGEGSARSVDPACPFEKDNRLALCSVDAACKCEDARNNTYNCVRRITEKSDFLLCSFQDSENFMEAYDLRKDPFQMQNLAPVIEKKTLNKKLRSLNKLKNCSGLDCHEPMLLKSSVTA